MQDKILSFVNQPSFSLLKNWLVGRKLLKLIGLLVKEWGVEFVGVNNYCRLAFIRPSSIHGTFVRIEKYIFFFCHFRNDRKKLEIFRGVMFHVKHSLLKELSALCFCLPVSGLKLLTSLITVLLMMSYSQLAMVHSYQWCQHSFKFDICKWELSASSCLRS